MAARKRRPRKHVIALMSFHHVGYLVATAGFTFEGIEADYGFDVSINTFDAQEQIENGVIYIQLKATDVPKRTKNGSYKFTVSKKDANYWGNNTDPVYLVLYDVHRDVAISIHFQRHLEVNNIDLASIKANSIQVLIPDVAISTATIAQWRVDKNRVFAQLPKVSYV